MKTKLKPVIKWNYPDCFSEDSVYDEKQEGMIDVLVIPLTPASRKAIIEAIEKGIARDLNIGGDALIDKVAEAALKALEKMAGPEEKQ